MPTSWNILSGLIAEADEKQPKLRAPTFYRDALLRLILNRYGEHELDTFRDAMKSASSFKDWRQQVGMKYMSAEIDGLIGTMHQASIAAKRAKDHEQGGDKAKIPGTSGGVRGSSGKQYLSPDDYDDKQSKIDAARQARASVGADNSAAASLMTPNTKQGHTMGTAGQNQARPQPSVDAGIAPQSDDGERKSPKSGLVKAQKEVDRETKDNGEEAGNALAARLGVPTTADRTSIDHETGQKRARIWPPDKVLDFMAGERPIPGDRNDAGDKTVSIHGADAVRKTDADRKAQSHARAKSAMNPDPSKRIDPDRLDKIKRGLIKRNAAPSADKIGPDRPGRHHGDRWKPHGREQERTTARPDPVTGNFSYGKMKVDPKHTGAEAVWDEPSQRWITGDQWDEKYPKNDRARNSMAFAQRAQDRAAQQSHAKASDDRLRAKVAGSPAIKKGMKPAVQPEVPWKKTSQTDPDPEDDEYPEDQGWSKIG